MAFTYKIKPLEWRQSRNDKDYYLSRNATGYDLFLNGLNVWTVYSKKENKYKRFSTKEDAQEWVEEKHISIMRSYLEEV